jgi:hypothetical protein
MIGTAKGGRSSEPAIEPEAFACLRLARKLSQGSTARVQSHKTQYGWLQGGYTAPETTKPNRVGWVKSLIDLGWLMGLEPTTTGITILDSTN